jgi:membrane-bound lytic murein transglycosylase B
MQTDLWPEAQKSGISEKTFKAAFAGVELDWTLNDLAPPGFPKPRRSRSRRQAEFSSPAPISTTIA